MTSEGIVYVLTNPAIPGMVKNGEQRFLSAITAELMGMPGQPVHGGRYWSWGGRNLLELYEETYGSDEVG